MNRNLTKPKVNKPWKPKDGGSHIRSEAEWKEMMSQPYVKPEVQKEVEKAVLTKMNPKVK